MSHSKSLLVILSLMSVVLLTVLVLGVYDIKLKNKETSELLNLADNAAELEILVQSIRAIQSEAGKDLATFDSLVLSESKLVPLIESIEGVGRAVGLDVEIVSVGENEDPGASFAQIVRIVVETRGSWASSLSFLRAVESLPNRVIVDETTLSKQEDGWNSRIVLSLYSFD
ncbi:MAG: hypothetical protein WAX80_02045 [Minisyncoccia bacterium]